MTIANRLKTIQAEIQKRTSREVTLLAVTKTRLTEEILEAVDAGLTTIGENRLSEARHKFSELPKTVRKYFIGRLQTNKVTEVVRLFDVIQTVDRLKLAKKIDLECGKIGKTMPILIQVNTSGEEQKGGCKPGETEELIREMAKLKNIRIEGLMTMAVHSETESLVRECFRKLKSLSDELRQKNISNVKMETLSMGMTGDYLLAVEEGSTMVRIGRKLFKN